MQFMYFYTTLQFMYFFIIFFFMRTLKLKIKESEHINVYHKI